MEDKVQSKGQDQDYNATCQLEKHAKVGEGFNEDQTCQAEGKNQQEKLKDLLRFVKHSGKEHASFSGSANDTKAIDIQRESAESTTGQTVPLKTPGLRFTGPSTQGVKKSLEFGLSNEGPVNDLLSRTCEARNDGPDAINDSLGSLPAPPFLLPPFFNPCTVPSTTYQNSSAISNSRSHSIIAHILTGEDKNLGAELSNIDDECGDINSFLNDPICDHSIVDNLGEVATEWDMKTRMSVSPGKDTPSSSALSPTSVISSLDSPQTAANSLLIVDRIKGDRLRQDISQALQTQSIKIVKWCDAISVCSSEAFHLIWVHLTIPVHDEFINIINTIRYSSKKNKSAYIIAITDKETEADLHLRGFDEVYQEPIPKETIRQKYLKFKWLSTPVPQGSNTTSALRDATDTPESTLNLEYAKTTECSQSSTCGSVSSGMDINEITLRDLKGTSLAPARNKSPFLTECERESLLSRTPSPPSWCRVEHATKEKHRSIRDKLPAYTEKKRRERIKDSCDQLRVLLPYVRGRKTDMASILEMTVDYLKIVNAALPQDFQSQVIEIMSNGSPALEGRIGDIEKVNMASKRMNRGRTTGIDISPLGKPLQIVEKNKSVNENTELCSIETNTRMMTRSLSRTVSSTLSDNNNSNNYNNNKKVDTSLPNVTTASNLNLNNPSKAIVVPKRECPSTMKAGISKAKKPHITIVSSMEDAQSSSLRYLPTGTVTPLKETKKDSLFDELKSQNHHFSGLQFPHMFTEGDISANRMFSTGHMGSSDLFPYQSQTQMSVPSARVGSGDRGNMGTYGGMYFDGAYYHYYPSLQDSHNGNYYVSGGTNEYVNPNAILPITSYNARIGTFTSGRRFDRPSGTELDRFGVAQTSDLYNNNSSSNIEPGNP